MLIYSKEPLTQDAIHAVKSVHNKLQCPGEGAIVMGHSVLCRAKGPQQTRATSSGDVFYVEKHTTAQVSAILKGR